MGTPMPPGGFALQPSGGLLGEMPMRQTNGLIASVTDSKDNLFSSNLMPLPPKFTFQARQGRINWRQVMNLDLDKIVRDVDLKQLESMLQNLTYAHLDRDDMERLGDAHFVKLFRLSQLSIEYLIYTQNYLETLTKSLDLHYKHSYEETKKVSDGIKKQQDTNQTLKKEIRLKQKTLSTYEYLLKLPSDEQSFCYKCKRCDKYFISKKYLQKHYLKAHPDVDFYSDYKSEADFEKVANPHQLKPPGGNLDKTSTIDYEKQIAENEQMYSKIKKEMHQQLSENLAKVNADITDIKTKQTTLSSMDTRKEDEQRLLAESLQKPARMFEELKDQWENMMANQTESMKDLVNQTVNEALSNRKNKDSDERRLGATKEELAANARQVKQFEDRIRQFENEIREKDKNLSVMRTELDSFNSTEASRDKELQ